VKRNEVWCPRSKHRLAWVEYDEQSDDPVVVANIIAAGRTAGATVAARIPAAEVRGDPDDPYAEHRVTVSCPCGGRWSLDLVAVLDGRPQTLARETWKFPGVSWDRSRHKGR
jgi:hypothetical protein